MLAMWIILYTFCFIILHACAKELRIVFACLSVCQFVSPVKKVFVDRVKRFSKLTVALTL